MSFQSLHLKEKVEELGNIKRKGANIFQEVDCLLYKQRFKRRFFNLQRKSLKEGYDRDW